MSQAEYTRIGGWLLAPLAYLIVTLLSASLMLLLYAMAIFMPESRDYLLTNAQAFTLQWYFSVLTTLLMWGFTLWLVFLFCQRSQRFPKLFLLWLLITVILAGHRIFAYAGNRVAHRRVISRVIAGNIEQRFLSQQIVT